ncbi:hypothetical protein PEBR_29250 [Penicillium brasilianum]|uniref:Ketoreductase (KR) domain-containing protein n=1 Tax=Penicillium brasilianum TaxID=104259 RepID=A0A1S9RHA5_PENBI|nr:hypothetical protein PEBR_29250 [Penicillium brasilianum]
MLATVLPVSSTQPPSSHDTVLVMSNKMGPALDSTWLVNLQHAISEDVSIAGSLPSVYGIDSLAPASVAGKGPESRPYVATSRIIMIWFVRRTFAWKVASYPFAALYKQPWFRKLPFLSKCLSPIGKQPSSLRSTVQGTCMKHSTNFFVIQSFVVGVTGNASHANYAAAGSYQDALAGRRVARGLDAVAIDLGVSREFLWLRKRPASCPPSAYWSYPHQRKAQVVIGFHTGPRFHWNLDDDFPLERETRFVVLQPVEGGQKKARIEDGSGSLASRLATVSSAVEAVDLVGVAIAKKLSEIFMLPVDDIALTNKACPLWIDSLVSVELRNMLPRCQFLASCREPVFGGLAADIAAKSSHVQ